MNFTIITLFPEIFDSVFQKSIIARALSKKLIKINYVNPRNFAVDNHKTVDDKPYGGGKGMVMKVDIVKKALDSLSDKPYIILLSASGKKYTQKMAQTFVNKKNIALVCGHYEGIDARVEKFVDEVISIGDFVTTGGEIPAMAVVDSVSRLIPTVITKGSLKNESFDNNLLEAPQYTRPEEFRGLKVPKVLLSGDHKKIEKWRESESKKRTKKFRPDLLKK